MKKFAVAYLFFENDNQVHFTEAETPAQAIKNVLVDICTTEEARQSQINWNRNLPDDIEELLDNLANAEISMAAKEIVL